MLQMPAASGRTWAVLLPAPAAPCCIPFVCPRPEVPALFRHSSSPYPGTCLPTRPIQADGTNRPPAAQMKDTLPDDPFFGYEPAHEEAPFPAVLPAAPRADRSAEKKGPPRRERTGCRIHRSCPDLSCRFSCGQPSAPGSSSLRCRLQNTPQTPPCPQSRHRSPSAINLFLLAVLFRPDAEIPAEMS